MFFNGWMTLARTGIVGLAAYAPLVVLLRVAGKRSLSKMNAFDFVVTVALGSTLATVLLSKDVALAEGALAFALLLFLQFGITWLAVRSQIVSHLVKSNPRPRPLRPPLGERKINFLSSSQPKPLGNHHQERHGNTNGGENYVKSQRHRQLRANR